MSEMVERVARAIHKARAKPADGEHWFHEDADKCELSRQLAIAAIAAMPSLGQPVGWIVRSTNGPWFYRDEAAARVMSERHPVEPVYVAPGYEFNERNLTDAMIQAAAKALNPPAFDKSAQHHAAMAARREARREAREVILAALNARDKFR